MMPEQDCRSVGGLTTQIWITRGEQLYVLYCRAKVDDELPGAEFNDSITGVGPVPRCDCNDGIPGYVEGASEWGVDLTIGFKLAWVAVPTAVMDDRSGYKPHDKLV